MRTLVLLIAASALGQPPMVSGIIVDESGNPVAGAWILSGRKPDNSGPDGRFRFNAGPRYFFVEARGFDWKRLEARVGEPILVTLSRASLNVKRCSTGCDSVPNGKLCFPRVRGVKVSKLGRDVDYAARYFETRKGAREATIYYGVGPTWSTGPGASEFQESTEYSARTMWIDDVSVTDARGQFTNGKRWRKVRLFGESASYTDVDPDLAARLDRVLDGVCAPKPITLP